MATRYQGKYARKRRRSRAYYQRELKFKDGNAVASDTIPNSGEILPIAFTASPTTESTVLGTMLNIPQGTGETQRIGRVIRVKSVMIRYHCLVGGGTTDIHDEIKLYLVLDKQCNGGVATIGDILGTGSCLAFRNLQNVNRFKILATRYIQLSSAAGAGNGTTNLFEGHIQDGQIIVRGDWPIEYSGTTGAISELRSNNIFLLAISRHG